MVERVSVVLCALLWVGGGCGSEGREGCDRVCDGKARRCHYEFVVGLSRRETPTPKVFLAVNGASPGPAISVCENDTILVDVKNNLPSGLETSLHWHGFSEGNSPFMDGVPFITQCPISPRTTFRYHLTASRSGTFFYRAHSVAQQLDGVYGPLIVHGEGDRTTPEEVVVVSAEMQSLQVLERSYEQNLNVEGLRTGVYGLGGGREGKRGHRVRVINAAGFDCPVTLFTHIVPLRVVAVDGNPVEPVGMNEIIVSPGERVDLMVKPEVMKAIHVIGHNLCKGHAVYGLDPSVSDKSEVVGRGKALDFEGMLRGLKSKGGERLPRGDVRVFLSFDASVFKGFKGAVDFRYKLGALTSFAPSVLIENEVSLLQFHNKSFLYPPSPLLSQRKDLQGDLLCQPEVISERCKAYNNGFCECLQTVELPYNYNVDLFIVDEGKNSNASQTVHIHGHSFHVLAVESFDRPITAVELWEKEVLGKIQRNLVGPIKKDTVVVPNKGFVCLRVRPTNPGKWLLESTTSKAKTGYGLEIVLNVENPAKDPIPPEGFPTCGNMKEPDMVFTDD